jgi:hypothetical protein
MNWTLALVMAGPGATALLTFRVAPQPAETIAAVRRTVAANVRIVFSSTSCLEEQARAMPSSADRMRAGSRLSSDAAGRRQHVVSAPPVVGDEASARCGTKRRIGLQ